MANLTFFSKKKKFNNLHIYYQFTLFYKKTNGLSLDSQPIYSNNMSLNSQLVGLNSIIALFYIYCTYRKSFIAGSYTHITPYSFAILSNYITCRFCLYITLSKIVI